MFCPNCGNQLKESAAFCTKCGTPVGGGPGVSTPISNPHYQSYNMGPIPQGGAVAKRKEGSIRGLVSLILSILGLLTLVLSFFALSFSGNPGLVIISLLFAASALATGIFAWTKSRLARAVVSIVLSGLTILSAVIMLVIVMMSI